MKPEEYSKNDSSELKIIDLDKLDDDTAMDYEKLSQEESLAMETEADRRNTDDSEEDESTFMHHVFKINWHLVLFAVMVFSVIFVVYRVKNWGTRVDLNSLDYSDADLYDIEVNDNIVPLIYNGDAPAVSDGETNIVLFGNDTMAQNRGTKDDMANMIAELTGANVYNCAVTGSYLASTNYFIDPETDAMDAFNLYWLTTSYAVDNKAPYEKVFANYSDKISSDAQAAFETLSSIDFNYVDVIGIMYDANDYLANKPLGNLDNPTDVLYFTGNLVASIELIQETYPHIRIIVMSPTYAYAIGADGSYVESDEYETDEGYTLSEYALIMAQYAIGCGVSFVDNIYGTVNLGNADNYLLDNINLNTAGRQKIAERFVYALEYYND